jgi:sporulation protein YlmC with PRC-barrel domain
MKKITAFILGIALAGGAAFAQEPADTAEEATDQATEYGEEAGEWAEETAGQTEPDDATMDQTDPMSAEDEMAEGLSAMTAEELEGKTVVTASGEEVGEIDSIGESETHQARVATIDVGGFLGVAEKKIAIPLSDLEMSSDGNIVTNMTKEAIETEEEFDETGFTEENSDDTGY